MNLPAVTGTERIYYDGSCALCHGFVLFVLRRDPAGALFRFAPLEGETFRARFSAEMRAKLPDSVLVETAGSVLLERSDGVIHVLRRLGGSWRLAADLLGIVPRPIRDLGYDAVAKVRKRLFAKPPDVCPVVDPATRARFDF